MDFGLVQSYLDPKMLIVIAALWVVGYLLKVSPIIPDKWIIWALTLLALVYAVIVLGFTGEAFIQGIIAAGIAVYTNQLVKQSSKQQQMSKPAGELAGSIYIRGESMDAFSGLDGAFKAIILIIVLFVVGSISAGCFIGWLIWGQPKRRCL